jgi:outer membrane protein OmpA-like peptidoglycan-associated protein
MAHRLSVFGPLLLASAAALALMGCDTPGFKSKVKSPSQLSQQPIGTTNTTSAGMSGVRTMGDVAQTPAVFTPGLSVSDMIAQACGIKPRATSGGGPAAAAAAAPSFEYDSAALGEADRQMLGEVAKCLTEGALKGKNVTLIGRADARGEPEYNMTLGSSRSDTVQRYMVDLGVGKDRMRSTSRGEMDATGTNEEGYAHDRRVDLELVL